MSANSKLVLLVIKDRAWENLISIICRRLAIPVNIVFFEDMEEAMNTVSAAEKPFDLVITSYKVNVRGDGVELAKAVSSGAKTPVIILYTFLNQEERQAIPKEVILMEKGRQNIELSLAIKNALSHD